MPGTVFAAARLDRLAVSTFHRRTAALLAYVFFFELGDLNSFAYAAPALRQQWQLSIATIATITSASFVGMFIGAMTAGTISDHLGRKRALLLTTVWYSSMSLLNAVACIPPAGRSGRSAESVDDYASSLSQKGRRFGMPLAANYRTSVTARTSSSV